jgi:hypothetical protein
VVVFYVKKREIAKMAMGKERFYGKTQKINSSEKHYTVKKHTQIFQPKILNPCSTWNKKIAYPEIREHVYPMTFFQGWGGHYLYRGRIRECMCAVRISWYVSLVQMYNNFLTLPNKKW